jgi:hypothetical protein
MAQQAPAAKKDAPKTEKADPLKEAAEEANNKDPEEAKELKEFRENGGPPPICNGTNGEPGIDCRRPPGPPKNPRIAMKPKDFKPANAVAAPNQGEGPVPGQSTPKPKAALV